MHTQVTSCGRSCELRQLSNAQMSSFSRLALSAPSCCHHQRKPFNHAHSSARHPQLNRLTDLCPRRQALGHAHAKAINCAAGQVQSTLQSTCCSTPWSQSKFLRHRHFETWFCLCCRAMEMPPTSNGRKVRCQGDCQPRISCANLILRRWIVRHTRRQHRSVAHTPPGPARAQSRGQRASLAPCCLPCTCTASLVVTALPT